MLLFDAFKPIAYQRIEALGYYTPGVTTTIKYKIGKQNSSSVTIPTTIAKALKVEVVEGKKYFTELPETLYIHKDSDTGFKTLRLKEAEDGSDED